MTDSRPSTGEPYVQPHPGGLVLSNPPRDWIIQGLLVALLLPVAVVLLGVLAALALGLRSDQTVAWAILGGLVGLGCLVSLAFGGVDVLLAGGRSRRSRVELDGSTGTATRGGRTVLGPGEALRVRVHKPSALLKWWGISVDRLDGGAVLLLGKLPPSRNRAIRAAAERVAETLGVDAEIPAALTATGYLGLSPQGAGALCYLPFQGIFLLASVWFALTSKDTFVRFCARQSLLQFALAMGLLVPILGCSGLLGLLLTDRVHPAVVMVPLALLLVAYQAWRIVTRIVACWRAYHGKAWVIPWLGRVSRRWLPPEP